MDIVGCTYRSLVLLGSRVRPRDGPRRDLQHPHVRRGRFEETTQRSEISPTHWTYGLPRCLLRPDIVHEQPQSSLPGHLR